MNLSPTRYIRAVAGRGCAGRSGVIPLRPRNQATSHRPRTPTPEPGAIWQAGVTADSDQFKVLFNGEPDPRIVAAGIDWVILLPEPRLSEVRISDSAPLGAGYLADPIDGTRRVEGRVEIVHADGTKIRKE